MKERLIRLLDSEQLSASKFADLIGVQRSSVSHVLSGRNKPGFDFLQKTLKAFPLINSDWLILGEGDMMSGARSYVGGTLFDTPQRSVSVGDAEDTPLQVSDEEESVNVKGKLADITREHIPGAKPGKKVIKVVLFYEDDTFSSFDPSK